MDSLFLAIVIGWRTCINTIGTSCGGISSYVLNFIHMSSPFEVTCAYKAEVLWKTVVGNNACDGSVTVGWRGSSPGPL